MNNHGGKRENAGRPRGGMDIIRKEISELITEADVNLAFSVLRKKMQKGDNSAAMYLLDQRYGKARQKIDANLAGGIMLVVNDLTGK